MSKAREICSRALFSSMRLSRSSGSSYGCSSQTFFASDHASQTGQFIQSNVNRKAEKKRDPSIRGRPFFPRASGCPFFPRASGCPSVVLWTTALNSPSNLSPSKVLWRIAAPDAAPIALVESAASSLCQGSSVVAPCDASVHQG